MMDAILEVSDLHYSYPDGTPALRGVSFAVPAGARAAIMGANGAGKSTLLLHLNRLLVPARGTIEIYGRRLDSRSQAWARTRVGLLFQDPDDQVFMPTVWDDVAFGPLNQGLPTATVRTRVEAALSTVGLAEHAAKPPHHLSLGQKRKVALAGLLAMDQAILAMDEPLAHLDARGAAGFTGILENLNQAGKTLLIATHDVDFAIRWADLVIVLAEGRVVATGTPGLLLDPGITGPNGLARPRLRRPLRLRAPGFRAHHSWRCRD